MFQYILLGIMGATLIGGSIALFMKRPKPPMNEKEKAIRETIDEEKAQVKELREAIRAMKEEILQKQEAKQDSLEAQQPPDQTP